MRELRLSEIWIYPIKSLGGIQLQKAFIQKKGIQYDRRWMLIDESNKFITQRVHPIMALFKLSISEDRLTIQFKNDFITLSLSHTYIKEPIQATIWDDVVTVHEVSQTYSKWFSEKLGYSCKLVAFPEENERPVDPNFSTNHEQVSLADAFPFLIIGQRSLDYLNTKLEEALPINRFRPNFVFTGGDPHEEDTWRDITIGANKFIGVKPCSRCVLTTVNQDTGEKGLEPLKTLATYRKIDTKILFGQNLVAVDLTTVQVGDHITVQSYQKNKNKKSIDS